MMSKKVLVVDDSLFVYEQMKTMLAGTEYELSLIHICCSAKGTAG